VQRSAHVSGHCEAPLSATAGWTNVPSEYRPPLRTCDTGTIFFSMHPAVSHGMFSTCLYVQLNTGFEASAGSHCSSSAARLALLPRAAQKLVDSPGASAALQRRRGCEVVWSGVHCSPYQHGRHCAHALELVALYQDRLDVYTCRMWLSCS
jgi:hypothetical protein